VQTLATTITAMEKMLDLIGEAKTGIRSSEDTQGEKQEGKGKKKDKGKAKTSKGVRIMPSKQMQ
jgi:hypothetical protein